MDGYVGDLRGKYAGINESVPATRIATVQVPYSTTPEGAPEAMCATVFFQEASIATGF